MPLFLHQTGGVLLKELPVLNGHNPEIESATDVLIKIEMSRDVGAPRGRFLPPLR